VTLSPLPPTNVAPLFRPLLAELIRLLRTLEPSDWERPTVAAPWRVRDVAAHLLDVELRKIAAYRDAHDVAAGVAITSDEDLSRLVNGMNASAVAFATRLSPRLLLELLDTAGTWAADVIESLPSTGQARFPVSWAGESDSQNWMDIGRDYTERWHHQAQIRDATGRPRLLSPQWAEPLLEFSVRTLPHAYAGVKARTSTVVTLRVEGDTPGSWSLIRADDRWDIFRGAPEHSDALVRCDTDDAWRLFYNALPPAAVTERIRVEGDAALAQHLLRARSVIL
jgi:uncharacterized protein (TIGR03083 family)